MKANWKSIALLTAALAMVAPILAGCSGTPAGNDKAGVEAGDVVVSGVSKNGGGPQGKGGGAGPKGGGKAAGGDGGL